MTPQEPHKATQGVLYTKAQRQRRDETVWTIVQGILAPAQFLVFVISLALVLRFLLTGEGYLAATWSILVKTAFLYVIMITGSIWEKIVFDQWIFANSFFWEDVFSFAVIALHTAYIWALFWGNLGAQAEMMIALAAYAAYVINAGQFLMKLRAARLQSDQDSGVTA
ncbi:MAG: 2-vinyl bacteriochlorophyllide hydratase [Cyanobacteria bacterium P01_A01_bin.17]